MRGRLGLVAAVACALGVAICGSAAADIYWANSGGTSIGRAGNDGSNADQSFVAGAGAPTGVALDGTFLYWAHTDAGTGKIGRSAIDGTGANQGFLSVGDPPLGIAVDNSRIYWTHSSAGAGKVGRTNIGGLGPLTQQFVPTASTPCGVAVEPDHLYWANTGDPGAIGRAHGSFGVLQDFVSGTSNPCGVAYAAGWVYWANRGNNTIGRARLEGTEIDRSFVDSTGVGPANSPCGVAVDGTHVYWSAAGGTIGRVGLDGSGFDSDLVSGATSPCGMAVDATASATPPTHTFSQTAVGSESDIQAIYFANTSSSVLSVVSASFVGVDAADFEKTGDGCSSSRVAAGGGCVINVRMKPGSVGPRSATLRVTSTAADSPTDIQLTGGGVAPPPLPPMSNPPAGDLSAPPAAPNPGAGPIGTTTPPASPAAGLERCASRIEVGTSGTVSLCRATNPPATEVVQTLKGTGSVVLARSRTVIPAGQTRSVVARLGAPTRKALRKRGFLKVRSQLVVRGPGGESATVERRVTLRARGR